MEDRRMAADIGVIAIGVGLVACLFVGIWLGEITAHSRGKFVLVVASLTSAPVLLLWGIFEETSHRCTEIAPNGVILAVGWLGAGGALALDSGLLGRIAFRKPLGAVALAAVLFATLATLMAFAFDVLMMGDCATLPSRYRT
jgi:hypothetical protein